MDEAKILFRCLWCGWEGTSDDMDMDEHDKPTYCPECGHSSFDICKPAYFSFISEASHNLYLALESMRRTPCTKKEDFEKLIGIYSDLGDFSDRILKRDC